MIDKLKQLWQRSKIYVWCIICVILTILAHEASDRCMIDLESVPATQSCALDGFLLIGGDE